MLETVLFLHWYKTNKAKQKCSTVQTKIASICIYIDVAGSLRSNSALAHVTILDFDRCAAKSYATLE